MGVTCGHLVILQSGQSALSIAEQLGFISVVEILRQVTQVIVTTTTDKYKLHSPEMMHEPAMSDDDDDGTMMLMMMMMLCSD